VGIPRLPARRGEREPGFGLRLKAQASGLLARDGAVTGVAAVTPEGLVEIEADLVIAADGRGSTLRGAAGLAVRDLGAPIDVLWMRIARHGDDPSGSGGRIGTGRFMAMIDRGTYWQCAYLIPKGGIDAIRARGLTSFRQDVAAIAPMFAGRLDTELPDWDAVKLLSVRVDRLEQWWKPGLLCIGDAAHAMSPIGGVGINLAIQDAVAAANILAAPLADRAVRAEALTPLLARVQARRLLPTRITQAVQVAVQNRLLDPLLDATEAPRMPWLLKVLDRFAALQALPAYAVGVGVRPERVRSPRRAPPVPAA
jgi:2-polyprenyl-6-methoxyphenol hydroxylase-like FAD-dependent oxidoreductase